MSIIIGLLTILCLLTSSVSCQGVINGPRSKGNDCCSKHLMDVAWQRVAMETSSNGWLGAGQYRGLRLRICTTDSLTLQIWTQLNNNRYQLKWQETITASSIQTTLSYVTIPLTNNVADITSSDRLAIFSTNGLPLPVPFSVNESSTVELSDASYTTSFAIGDTLTTDNSYQYSRTFHHYVQFCTQSDCSDKPVASTQYGSEPSDSAIVSPATEPCCLVNASSVLCDPSSDVTDSLTSQTELIYQLQETINTLNDIMSVLISRNYVTGLCPAGFLSGSYSIGSCYLMFRIKTELAVAIQNCRKFGAYLLTIESDAEQQFIRDFVRNNSYTGQNTDQFWTTGLYEFETKSWYWYSGLTTRLTTTSPSNRIQYSKWQNVTTPTPSSSNDICLLLVIDGLTNTEYWINSYCHLTNYYICEIPKVCL